MTTINHNAAISLPNLEKSKVTRHSPGLALGEDVIGNWQVFLAGMFCGTLLQMAVIGGFWWKSAYGHTDLQEDWIVVRSAEDEELYDRCLADSGNIVACDATMRLLDRYRAAENAEMTSIKSEVTKMAAAGVSRCAVAKWGYESGLVGSQVARALGIPESHLFICK